MARKPRYRNHHCRCTAAASCLLFVYTATMLKAMHHTSVSHETPLATTRLSSKMQIPYIPETRTALPMVTPKQLGYKHMKPADWKPAFLHMCVVTARRVNSTTYLPSVIESLSSQMMGKVSMQVVSVDGSLQDGATTILEHRTIAHCSEDEKNEFEDSKVAGLVPCKVRQQTWDVTCALEQCWNFARATWTMVVEDDTVLCEKLLSSILATLETSSVTGFIKKHAKAYKFSKSFSGTAFHTTSLHPFTRFAREMVRTHPVDWSLHSTDWNSSLTLNTVQLHELNLFHHIGEVSTFLYRNLEEFRNMYGELRSDQCLVQLKR